MIPCFIPERFSPRTRAVQILLDARQAAFLVMLAEHISFSKKEQAREAWNTCRRAIEHIQRAS